MSLYNFTPYKADYTVITDDDGWNCLVVCAKATFKATQQGALVLHETQTPISWQDKHYGDPAESSIQYASDLVPHFSGTDVILHGFAYPERTHDTSVHVGLQVGMMQKVVTVFGHREWMKLGGMYRISSPKPFSHIPLQYEYAFGGKDQSHQDSQLHDIELRNPVGRGFRTKESALPIDGQPLPMIEMPSQLIKHPTDTPQPAGFGFIAGHWQPRMGFAGTYDADWIASRMPLRPLDFDRRFYQVASEGLVSPKPFIGNEPVQVVNATANGRWQFRLPNVQLEARLNLRNKPMQTLNLGLNRVLIDAENLMVTLGMSGTIRIKDQSQIENLTITNLSK